MFRAGNHCGGGCGSSVCHAGCGRPIPEGNGEDGEAHLRFVGKFFPADSEWRPLDMFFSANLDYPKKLEAAGLTELGSYYEYAKGKIVTWVRSESKLDLSSGMKVLLDPSVKKIAVANPQHRGPFAGFVSEYERQRPVY
jgi:Bacterial extracellular solute-binding protein